MARIRNRISRIAALAGDVPPLRALILPVALLLFAWLPRLALAAEPVRLRINTTHGLDNARGAVMDAGLSLASQVLVSASSDRNGRPYLPPDALLSDGLAHGATILSSSFSGWHYLYDSAGYPGLTQNGVLHVYAYEPRRPQPPNAPPPAAFVTVNRVGAKSGGGIEFGVVRGYMGGRGGDGTPSGVTAQLAGLMACLKYRHPSWNWFDVKAALRATAANYPVGYDPRGYGYGAIDYRAADALGSPERLPLFGPAAVVISQSRERVIFRVNAFRQRRRFTDVLFRFEKRPSATRGELTLHDITALGGSFVCSTYLHRDDASYGYRLSPGESAYFVWFTRDLAGNYSRIEPYGVLGPFRGDAPLSSRLRSSHMPMAPLWPFSGKAHQRSSSSRICCGVNGFEA